MIVQLLLVKHPTPTVTLQIIVENYKDKTVNSREFPFLTTFQKSFQPAEQTNLFSYS